MLKFQPNKPEGEVETFIGSSVKVEGKFSGNGNVSVEGVLSGSLKTVGNLKIGKTAKITANIEARNVHIAGEVRGNIKAREHLIMEATAKVFGDVEVKTLQIAEGAILQGKCMMVAEPVLAGPGNKIMK